MSDETNWRHLAIVGPTASGKSGLALQMASENDELEIVSVDSMQVYRGMDIGTAKPSIEEQERVKHHLIDLVEATCDFTVQEFQVAAREALIDIESRGKTALLVGGTGLYLQAITDDLAFPGSFPDIRADLENTGETNELFAELSDFDPEAAQKMEPNNRRRIVRALEVIRGTGKRFSSFGPGVTTFGPTNIRMLGIWLPREQVAHNIEERYTAQMQDGFLDEVRLLDKQPPSRTARQALGYRELLAHLAGKLTLDEALTEAIRRTKSFARRQRVWFRRDPRITWLGTHDANDLVNTMTRYLEEI